MERFAEEQTPKHCFFEWIYFANVASTLDDRSVYMSRTRLGEELARAERELDRVPLDCPTRSLFRCPIPAKRLPTRWHTNCRFPVAKD